MRDIEPKESSTIEYIRQKFIETSNLFGFQFMEPSPIELVSVIETKSGPSIRNEIYYFTDKGDREVALRFDFTIGITRYAVSQKSMKLPAKFSTFGGVWRYDEPQKGRYRFFHQWDVEIYGEPNIESDAEIIDFTSKFFTNLKLENIVIDICDRELIESYIKDIFKSDSNIVSDILRAVDKSQKKRKQEIIKEYQEKGYSVSNLEKVLEFAQIKGTPLELQKINIHGDGSHVWVVSVNEDMKKVAISIASQLRLKGIATEVDLMGKSLRKQMEMASSSKHVIIAAPKEYADNLVIIRNMKDGSEKQVKIESVLSNPRSSLQL